MKQKKNGLCSNGGKATDSSLTIANLYCPSCVSWISVYCLLLYSWHSALRNLIISNKSHCVYEYVQRLCLKFVLRIYSSEIRCHIPSVFICTRVWAIVYKLPLFKTSENEVSSDTILFCAMKKIADFVCGEWEMEPHKSVISVDSENKSIPIALFKCMKYCTKFQYVTQTICVGILMYVGGIFLLFFTLHYKTVNTVFVRKIADFVDRFVSKALCVYSEEFRTKTHTLESERTIGKNYNSIVSFAHIYVPRLQHWQLQNLATQWKIHHTVI